MTDIHRHFDRKKAELLDLLFENDPSRVAVTPSCAGMAVMMMETYFGLAEMSELSVDTDGRVRLTGTGFEIVCDENGNALAYDHREGADQELICQIPSGSSVPVFDRALCSLLTDLGVAAVAARTRNSASDRELRLEGLLRRILPMFNPSNLPSRTRAELFQEMTEFRTAFATHLEGVSLSDVHHLLEMGEYGALFSSVSFNGQEGFTMALDVEEAGYAYMGVLPSAKNLKAFQNGSLCLREVMLEETTILFTLGSAEDGALASLYKGPLLECFLPSEGFYLSDITQPSKSEDTYDEALLLQG